MEKGFKSGFVAIIGRPNVGKSTLINSLLQRKVVIVSDKPQTTRNKIRCILNQGGAQVVFLDTPGLHKPHDLLGEEMNEWTRSALFEVDVILFMIDASKVIGRGDAFIANQLAGLDTPVILVLNKMDQVDEVQLGLQEEIGKDLGEFKRIIPISASTKENLDELLYEVIELLPEGPKYYPDDLVTDQPESMVIAEFIREKVFDLTKEEVPYGVMVVVEEVSKRDGDDIIDIHADIFVERDSQKGIVIGKDGSMIKEIGKRARLDIERLLGSQVHLNLRVKVKKKWRKDERVVSDLDY
ncbi:MAG: GTPase Era [Actinomycetota bacterium]|nr:GTPase Era [Actinomycetota bacterium]